MNKTTLKWAVGSILVAIILAATYYVVDINQKAMTGSANDQSSGLYGH